MRLPKLTASGSTAKASVKSWPYPLLLTAFWPFVISLFLLLPKFLLIDYYRSLWIKLPPAALIAVLREDLVVAAIMFFVSRACLRSPTIWRGAVCSVCSTTLLVVLLIDVRIRELWLRPLDYGLMAYGWRNRTDLASGLPLFFNHAAGWGMTFRRVLTFVVALHLLVWGAVALTIWRRNSGACAEPSSGSPSRRRHLLAVAALTAFAISGAWFGHVYRYRLDTNIFISWLTSPVRHLKESSASSNAGTRFDQKPQSASSGLVGPRLILQSAARFDNLVIVLLESVRWRDVQLGSNDVPYRNFRRLAQEGLRSQSYAVLPHSSKAYFSILTGRYPYPGIEMRESVALSNESFIRTLRDRLPASTFAFSSMFLSFENTSGLLASVGIDKAMMLETGTKAGGSSFGVDDGPLYEMAARHLSAQSGHFVTVLMPSAAHYPYEYPGKPRNQGSTHDAYLKCLAYADELLGKMIEVFQARGLLNNTLVVLVGDHGESFGEHGLAAHNSSLYDEEVTVPLIFWSVDGRLRHPQLILSRQIDIAPTILDLFGFDRETTPVQGVSLLRTDRLRRVYLSTFFDDLALAVVDYPKKIIYEPATEHLIQLDLETDPFEANPEQVPELVKRDAISRIMSFRAFTRHQFGD